MVVLVVTLVESKLTTVNLFKLKNISWTNAQYRLANTSVKSKGEEVYYYNPFYTMVLS